MNKWERQLQELWREEWGGGTGIERRDGGSEGENAGWNYGYLREKSTECGWFPDACVRPWSVPVPQQDQTQERSSPSGGKSQGTRGEATTTVTSSPQTKQLSHQAQLVQDAVELGFDEAQARRICSVRQCTTLEALAVRCRLIIGF